MKKVGKYIIEGRLGRGGMSTVYKAKAPVTGRTVALKVLLPRDDIFEELVGKERLHQIFIEEAIIMGEITHDHVAKIIDCSEDGPSPFIVLEYFAHSLGSLIGETYLLEEPSRIISINKTYEYVRQSLKGLERLHFAGIVHRDIKPFNLMITNDDRVKIIDFGLSRVRGEEKMAIPGMQVGSPYYAAPEQEINPQKADERADLFSVGIMAYRMVTGHLISHKNGEIPRPSDYNPELNDAWDHFLLKSISKSPDDRFPSAQEMRLELEYVHTAWAQQSRQQCTFNAMDQAGPGIVGGKLRAVPQFLRRKDLKLAFELDTLMRPQSFTPHRFEFTSNQLLHCLDTGLLWQRRGAEFPVTWLQAQDYVEYLNSRCWQGYSTWRLPTIEELFSLLRPPTVVRDFCYEAYFAKDIHWLWSCDTCTKRKVWTVDIQESYLEELDKDGMASVCAVATVR
jgi:serine/threonine-protein kinase